jgi:hypothetical protein
MNGAPRLPELLVGWRYMTVEFEDHSAVSQHDGDAFDHVAAGVLGAHPYRLFWGDNWVAVGWPRLPSSPVARLVRAVENELHGITDPAAEDDLPRS